MLLAQLYALFELADALLGVDLVILDRLDYFFSVVAQGYLVVNALFDYCAQVLTSGFELLFNDLALVVTRSGKRVLCLFKLFEVLAEGVRAQHS